MEDDSTVIAEGDVLSMRLALAVELAKQRASTNDDFTQDTCQVAVNLLINSVAPKVNQDNVVAFNGGKGE